MFFASLKVKIPNMTDWHISAIRGGYRGPFQRGGLGFGRGSTGAAEKRIASVSTVTKLILLQSILQSVQREMPRVIFVGKPVIMSARVEDVKRRIGDVWTDT